MEETKEFEQLLDKLLQTHKDLPNKVAAVAVNFTKQRFREQAWADTYQQPWKRRKEDRAAMSRRRAGRSRVRQQRAILSKSGRLKRSIRKITANTELVEIGTDVDYAQFHNEGFRGVEQVKAHTRHRYNKVKETYTTRTGRERTRTTRQVDDEKGDIKVRSHRRRVNMVARQFIGVSALLNTQIERLVTSEYMKDLKE